MENIHPEIRKAMDSISNEKVKIMARELAKYGLAIAIPHMHGDKGEFLPLPKGMVSFEAGLKVTFENKNDPKVKNGVAVMWRWDEDLQEVSLCASCSGNCCVTYPPSK